MNYMVKMSFLDYYTLAGNIQSELREKVMQALDISYGTFFNKLRNDSWTQVERERLHQVYTNHVNDLLKGITC